MKIGDIVTRHPITLDVIGKPDGQDMKGKVVYIHPKHRFHVVEFGIGKSAIRESFLGIGSDII